APHLFLPRRQTTAPGTKLPEYELPVMLNAGLPTTKHPTIFLKLKPKSRANITCKAGAPLAASPAFDCYALVSHYFLISLRSVITWWAIFHSPPCFSRTRFSDTRRLPVPTDEPLSLSI